jgi:acid-sensing ion channel, other
LNRKQQLLALSMVCPQQLLFDKLANDTNCNNCLETLREIRIPPEDTFVECKFRNKVINCTESFKEVVTEKGLCYTFNGLGIYRWDNVSQKTPEWNIDDGYNPSANLDAYPRRVLGAGSKFGLSVLLRIKQNDIDDLCYGDPGFWVTLCF